MIASSRKRSERTKQLKKPQETKRYKSNEVKEKTPNERKAEKPRTQCSICYKDQTGDFGYNSKKGGLKVRSRPKRLTKLIATDPNNANHRNNVYIYTIAEMQTIMAAFQGMQANLKSGTVCYS